MIGQGILVVVVVAVECGLRALSAVGDARGSEVGDAEDGAGGGGRGGKGDGERHGRLHVGLLGWVLVGEEVL